MSKLHQKCLLAHLERLTQLINMGLDDCVIEDYALVSSLDDELKVGKQILKEINYV